VLDVGCGLGGLMHLLTQKGHKVGGLTPDRFQVAYISDTYKYELIQSKFEKLDAAAHRSAFGTVINSESLQYIKLDRGLEILDTILMPGGRWIISDYFRTRDAHEKSGHFWDVFQEKLAEWNMKITFEQDISKHIRPTLAYFHMWGTRFGMPLYEFLTEKINRKNPALDYLLEEVLNETRVYFDDHIKMIEPEQFMRDKKYMILVIERN
jgi:cyclopropane fatty-acyl-phospholipid synthase-like methyltransferase